MREGRVWLQTRRRKKWRAENEDNDVEGEDDEEENIPVKGKVVVSSPTPEACKQDLDAKQRLPLYHQCL